ncbi:MAG: hypothetical protein HOZ81_37840 [Streptomyces sp.]|nr:hypothetical protein [Streptomyces sp.]
MGRARHFRGVHAIALQAYDRMIGLEQSEISVDGSLTEALWGGECAGRSRSRA